MFNIKQSSKFSSELNLLCYREVSPLTETHECTDVHSNKQIKSHLNYKQDDVEYYLGNDITESLTLRYQPE